MTNLLNTAEGITASTSILIIFLVVTLFGALKGLMRGIGRQTVRSLTIAISVIIALVMTNSISSALNESLAGKTVDDMLSGVAYNFGSQQLNDLIISLDAETVRMILAVPVAVVALPIMFTLSFVAISAIGELVHALICLILKLKMSKNNAATRFLGMILGAIQGAVVAGILLFPLGCFANLSDGMLDSMSEGGIKEGSMVEESYESLDKYLTDTKDNAIIKLVMDLAGSKLQQSYSTVVIDGEKQDAREQFYILTGIFGDISYLEECDFKAPTKDEQAIIDGIKNKLTDDDYMASIISGLMREVALAVKDERLVINLDEPYGVMLKDAISIFEDSSKENLGGDISTFLSVYYQLADCGALTAMTEDQDAVANKLTSKREGSAKTVISEIIDTLENYERTKPLVSILAKLSVSIMADNLGLDSDVAEIYDNVKGGLNDIANIPKGKSDTEYKTAVNTIITDTLADSGIEGVSAEIIDSMAGYVTENFKDTDVLADGDIDSIILSYYDAYLNSIEP